MFNESFFVFANFSNLKGMLFKIKTIQVQSEWFRFYFY
jgi:hypothetical protein